MNYILAVFKSRSETLFYSNMLKMRGIVCSVVNTPRMAGQTCGICVKFLPENFSTAQFLLSQKRFQGFAGFFAIRTQDGMIAEFRRI